MTNQKPPTWYDCSWIIWKVAKFGNIKALANMYEKGGGVKKSIDNAIYWYEKAAGLGDWDAKKSIKRLKGDQVAQKSIKWLKRGDQDAQKSVKRVKVKRT